MGEGGDLRGRGVCMWWISLWVGIVLSASNWCLKLILHPVGFYVYSLVTLPSLTCTCIGMDKCNSSLAGHLQFFPQSKASGGKSLDLKPSRASRLSCEKDLRWSCCRSMSSDGPHLVLEKHSHILWANKFWMYWLIPADTSPLLCQPTAIF